MKHLFAGGVFCTLTLYRTLIKAELIKGAVMALSFKGVEPVTFGEKACVPKITAEIKMRLADIKDYNEAADEVFASAFPNDESYVREFLREKMTVLDKQTLHAYLLGGERMAATVIGQLETTLREAMGGDLNSEK